MKNSVLFIITALFLTSGCATITRGTRQTFTVNSTPMAGNVSLSSGEQCVTPCTLKMKRGDPFIVKVSKPGYVTQTVKVTSKIKAGGGVTTVLGNALIGGLVGAAVDSSNGSMRDLSPNPVSVDLVVEPPINVTASPVAGSNITVPSLPTAPITAATPVTVTTPMTVTSAVATSPTPPLTK